MESYGYQLLKVIASLLVVLGFMGGVMALLKLFVRKRDHTGSRMLPVRILGRGLIGYRKDIVVVEVAGETLILGVTADNIVCLGKVEDKKTLEEFKKATHRNTSHLIEKILDKFNEPVIKRGKVAGQEK